MSKSKELYTTTEIVKELLENEPSTRNSDNHLYMRVLQIVGKNHGIDVDNMPVLRFFLHLKNLGFPAFETVRRTRQKLQATYPELAGTDAVEGQRMLNEEVFRDYARGMV